MRIGFSSIYSWRPHVEHLHFLASLAQQAGHEVRFLTCDADLPACYTRELRPSRSDWLHCTGCRAAGLRSYASSEITSIGALNADAAMVPPQAAEWSRSSAGTLGRFESDADFASRAFTDIVERLDPATRLAYIAARRWIEREKLDAVCLFNGRIDATRGVLEAARDAGIRFITTERTWFGDGLQLLPDENCLGLRSVDQMMLRWRDTPLDRTQALRAVGHVALRFLGRNTREWRAYNTAARASPWPQPQAQHRVLLVPSSRVESWGHPDWDCGWPDRAAAFDTLMDHFGLDGSDVVLRCHPNWSEHIGAVDGRLSERYYTDWAQRRGVHVIPSNDATSTLGLIEQAHAVVVCGGSAALEAGILGKQVIALTPSLYQQAGFQGDAYSADQLTRLTLGSDLSTPAQDRMAEHLARQALRFCHTMVYRASQFVQYVRCLTTTRYEYRSGADPQRLIRLIESGQLEADDETAATHTAGEDEVLSAIRDRSWAVLAHDGVESQPGPRQKIRRRWMFRPIDRLREAMPRGDR